jgi:hypothetical protein
MLPGKATVEKLRNLVDGFPSSSTYFDDDYKRKALFLVATTPLATLFVSECTDVCGQARRAFDSS